MVLALGASCRCSRRIGPVLLVRSEGAGVRAIGSRANDGSELSSSRPRDSGVPVYKGSSTDPRAACLDPEAAPRPLRPRPRADPAQWTLEAVVKAMEPLFAKKALIGPNVDLWSAAIYRLLGIPEDDVQLLVRDWPMFPGGLPTWRNRRQWVCCCVRDCFTTAL